MESVKQFAPNLSNVPLIEQLLRGPRSEAKAYVLSLSNAYMEKNQLKGEKFPRHDFMDHLIALEEPLTSSPRDEVLADVVQCAMEALMADINCSLSLKFVEECIRWREYYDPSNDLDYIYRYAPIVWESASQFYGFLGRDNTIKLWKLCDELHHEIRGLPASDLPFKRVMLRVGNNVVVHKIAAVQ